MAVQEVVNRAQLRGEAMGVVVAVEMSYSQQAPVLTPGSSVTLAIVGGMTGVVRCQPRTMKGPANGFVFTVQPPLSSLPSVPHISLHQYS